MSENNYSVLPIFNALNNKIIGLNIKSNSDTNCNKGIFIISIIEDLKLLYKFNKKYNLNINNIKKELNDLIKKFEDSKKDYKEKYVNLKKIGNGAYGTIYKVNIKNSDDIRVLKIIDKDSMKLQIKYELMKEDIEEEFNKYINDLINEVKNMEICNKNNNINSVKFYEFYDNEKEFVIVMEYCDDNLQSILNKKEKGFNANEIFDILHQLNNTFEIMVNNNIIHRDLKLANILIKYDKKDKSKFIVKLSDYGVSKKMLSLTRKCKTHAGTIMTMAPEILNEEEYNNECDLWSLGVIIYQLSFKEYPYNANTEIGLIKKINELGQTCLKKTKNEILDNLIIKLLIKDPKKRMKWEEYFDYIKSKVK